MPDLLNPDNFEFFARFFLAGFILFSVRSRYVIGEKPKASEVVFESIILSLINQLVFLILAPAGGILAGYLPEQVLKFFASITGDRAAFFVEILLLPSFLAVVFGVALRRGWNSAILRRLAMPIIHPTPRAYDFAFGDNQMQRFVIVTYAD